MLSSRTETVLKSMVSRYIESAVPVSSQNLVNDYELRVSPATIRNEMAYLEQEGYIIRPHPSAGGVPSDKGYRYYVESLTGLALPLSEQRLINHLFHQVEGKLEEWLSLAAALIARLAQNVAIVTMPKSADCQFKHLELVALQDSLALIILVLHGARVKQQLITFDQVITQAELSAMANRLNADYAGLTGSQILAKKGMELSSMEQQLTDCLVTIMRAEVEQEYNQPYLDGLHFMLNQPEFVRSHRMLSLMELVDYRSLLGTILPLGLNIREVQVIIGKENKAEVIRDCSVVISRYGLPDEAIGVMGVVGPTRMPYARIISAVSYLSSVLSGLVGELYGRETIAKLSWDNPKFNKE